MFIVFRFIYIFYYYFSAFIDNFSHYSNYFQRHRNQIEVQDDNSDSLRQIDRSEEAFNRGIERNNSRFAIHRIADQAFLYRQEIQELVGHFDRECMLLGSNDENLMRVSEGLRHINELLNQLATSLFTQTIEDVIGAIQSP